MPGFENTSAAHEARVAHAESEANVARAVECEPLPEPAERIDGAQRRLWAILHEPGTQRRDAIQAARVIIQESAKALDPLAELQKRLGTRQKAIVWARAYLARLEAEEAAELAQGKALASSPKVRQETAPAGESLQSANGAGDSPAGEPSE